VRLRLFEELTADATAARLGIPLSTCKHRLMRGLQAYRAALRQHLGDDLSAAAPGP
jgi:DNA-directed RNA polymerase specialized sigma24 family protein